MRRDPRAWRMVCRADLELSVDLVGGGLKCLRFLALKISAMLHRALDWLEARSSTQAFWIISTVMGVPWLIVGIVIGRWL